MTLKPEYKNTFDTRADLYNRARPTYPDKLFNELIKEIGLIDSSKLLEIAPGTGQATKSLAKHGYSITGIELGEALANVAQKELQQFPAIKIINDSFENVDLPDNYYDLVYVATAFHWIDPQHKFNKPHKILNDTGHLAIIRTCHLMTEETRPFFDATQPIYDKYNDVAEKITRYVVSSIDEIKPDDLDENLFTQSFFKAFPMRIEYTSDEYLDLLGTFSEVIAMQQDQREDFLDEIKNLIDTEFNGAVIKDFAIPLTIGKKVSNI